MGHSYKGSTVHFVLGATDVIPSGVIVIWSGSFSTIPAGFVLCDGSNGTPNLENRFVVCAGGTYGVGDTGGFASQESGDTLNTQAEQIDPGSTDYVLTPATDITLNTFDNRPPYYALAYVMKT
jgi:hypothetical protein